MTPEQAQAFHGQVWQAIEDLGNQECEEDCWGVDYSAAIRALFAVIYQHRPEMPEVPEGKTLFPGWRVYCTSCGRRYPCSELKDVASELGVEGNADE
jgi:hypothetical protein